jgi:hypothetical protein
MVRQNCVQLREKDEDGRTVSSHNFCAAKVVIPFGLYSLSINQAFAGVRKGDE